MARRKIFRDDQKLERRDMAEDQKQRWSSTESREGRLSYRKASAAVDDKYQRFRSISSHNYARSAGSQDFRYHTETVA